MRTAETMRDRRYSSQWEDMSDRALRGMHKIEKRLCGDILGGEMPPTSKWMRWRTYDRLASRHELYDVRWALITCRRMGIGSPR